MHGPAEFEMHVRIINDETGQTGKMSVSIGTFEYPTQEKVAESLARVASQLDTVAPGFRLMTKTEAFEEWCIEKVGEPFAMPGGLDWDAI
jgi:hypothetical protein